MDFWYVAGMVGDVSKDARKFDGGKRDAQLGQKPSAQYAGKCSVVPAPVNTAIPH